MSIKGIDSTREEIKNRCTLTEFILTNESVNPKATGQLTSLLSAIQTATKYISAKVRSAGLSRLFGEEGSTNVQGETVKKLDVISNDAFVLALRRCGVVSAMISEEDEKIIFVRDATGHYVVCFDPLDGSSNIDVNISIGTIYAIYRLDKKAKDLTEKDLLLPGNELVAAGYCMYGSATVMVLTINTIKGVHGFTLDPEAGEFVLSHGNIQIPANKAIYSLNQGNYLKWSDDVRAYVDSMCDPKDGGTPHSLRYVGSMVADVHRTLIYGGVFGYPADNKSKNGKLRLLYEANPMSLLVEKAGGRAIYAKGKRVLDIDPTEIHQRSPIFLGGTDNIAVVEKFLK
mmetsp:Transcript_9824/g.16524  ORF Transcript_9824/g.16524 Transcript_9824/m.16524 type:complete len:343 (+) Transcript_9824:25-1053(+)